MTDKLTECKEPIAKNNDNDGCTNEENRQQIQCVYATTGLPLNVSSFKGISVDFSEISFKEKIGHGSYGVVYKAFWRDRHVAIKEFGPKTESKAIITEVKQLSRVQHPNIIALYGIANNQLYTYLLMEYAEGGSLYDFLHGKVKPKYTPAHAMSWACQCAEGVAYLHSMKPKPLIHRDLKPLNLLLTDKGRILKICDFGTVADKATLMTNNKGSAAWMAPEVFEGSKYTEKCDIFSWGIVLWEVLSRQKPFNDVDNTYSIMWKIHKGERPPLHSDFPEPLKELMISCWKTKPELRPSMNHIVEVMKTMVSAFPGAEEPLEYEFIDQQIISPNSESTESDNFTLDFSSFTSSQCRTKSSDITDTTNNSVTSTCTSLEEDLSISPAKSHFNQHAEFPAVTARAEGPRCCSVIPEEPDEAITNDDMDEYKEPFDLTPTPESIQRYEAIRNNMLQMASVPMTPLEVTIDPNSWDFDANDSFKPKSDGRERLTVTDSKPLMVADKLAQRNIQTIRPPSANNNDENDSEFQKDVDKDTDGDEDSQTWHEMLDPDLQPEPPLDGNKESQEVYKEHRRLAKEYLRVDTDLYFAQDYKQKCLQELSAEDREYKEDLIRKMNEKEELLELYNTLKQQLAALQNEQYPTESRPMQASRSNNNYLDNNNNNNNSNSNNDNVINNNGNNDALGADNWIVIERNQDT